MVFDQVRQRRLSDDIVDRHEAAARRSLGDLDIVPFWLGHHDSVARIAGQDETVVVGHDSGVCLAALRSFNDFIRGMTVVTDIQLAFFGQYDCSLKRSQRHTVSHELLHKRLGCFL